MHFYGPIKSSVRLWELEQCLSLKMEQVYAPFWSIYSLVDPGFRADDKVTAQEAASAKKVNYLVEIKTIGYDDINPAVHNHV